MEGGRGKQRQLKFKYISKAVCHTLGRKSDEGFGKT